jgi:hypothetical protein
MASAIEQRAERVLAEVPDWIWDGDRLPVPVEHIADSCFGLHVRDVEDLRRAPGVPADLPAGQALSGLLLPSLGEIWVNAAEAPRSPQAGRPGGARPGRRHRRQAGPRRASGTKPPPPPARCRDQCPSSCPIVKRRRGGQSRERIRRRAADAGPPGEAPLRTVEATRPGRLLQAAVPDLRDVRGRDGAAAAAGGLMGASHRRSRRPSAWRASSCRA